MHLKDYYAQLEIQPSASLAEIKTAYRRLAIQYHPDTTHNDPYSTARFIEIKEAYEILTHPVKKEMYLQQRWYQQSIGRKRTATIISPETLLKQSLELERYISKLDVFRMDKNGLHDYIAGLLTNENLEKLDVFRDISTNDEIIRILLQCLQPLPLSLTIPLLEQLNKIKGSAATGEKLKIYLAERQKKHSRESYRTWIILLVVIAICLLIFFLGN
ncbi:MAG: DnaJ domain-containing protein [Chitinophagaceae bacterium]